MTDNEKKKPAGAITHEDIMARLDRLENTLNRIDTLSCPHCRKPLLMAMHPEKYESVEYDDHEDEVEPVHG